MSTGRKLPPDKVWDVLETMALEDEAERVAGLTDHELDQELAGHGLDPNAVRARGVALAAKLAGIQPAPAVAIAARPDRTASKQWNVVLAAAAIAAGALAIAIPTMVLTLAHRDDISPDRWEASTVSSEQRASLIRRNAGQACEERQWDDCRKGLDAAQALDPAGEGRDDVKTWRHAIDQALQPQNLPPPRRDVKP